METVNAPSKSKVTQKLASTTYYPAQFEDLIDPRTRKTFVTIITRKTAGVREVGIRQSDDGHWNIVTEEKRINQRIVLDELKKLSLLTGVEYEVEF